MTLNRYCKVITPVNIFTINRSKNKVAHKIILTICGILKYYEQNKHTFNNNILTYNNKNYLRVKIYLHDIQIKVY